MLLALALACAPKHPVVEGPEHPLLVWRAERDGKVSHFLGTCHLGVPLDDALPAPHDAALADARVIYAEADIGSIDPGAAVKLLWSDGPGLSTRISADRWRAAASAVRDTLPAPLVEHMEPWALASILPMAAGGADTELVSMDMQLQQRARAQKTPLRFVETVEQQAAMLAPHAEAFLESIGPQAGDPDEDAALEALCLRGDISRADVLAPEGDPLSDALLGARNRAWVPRLLPDLAEGGAFVAVGAAHMLGSQGLVPLLEAEGYTLTQLTTTHVMSVTRFLGRSSGIEPAPPLPPNLDVMTELLAPAATASICAEGQLFHTCFAPDAEACAERVRADAALCVLQHADELPTDGTAPTVALTQQITTCAAVGVIFDAIAHDRVADAPMCNLLTKALGSGR